MTKIPVVTRVVVGAGFRACNTSHYFGYCQAITKRGEQCTRYRAKGDDLFCAKHRLAEDAAREAGEGVE